MSNLKQLICALESERRELESALGALRTLEAIRNQREPITALERTERRGRKSMNPAERAEVSERMRRYWASRRKA